MADDAKGRLCRFHGGTLDNQQSTRLMFGSTPLFIMEPVYGSPDRHGNLNRASIIKRQMYQREPSLDRGGAIGYILYEVHE